MISALLYVGGALLVFAGTFMPLAARIHNRPPEQQAAAVLAAPGAWRWQHALLGAGATSTAAAAVFEAIGSDRTAFVSAAVGLVLGAAFFLHYLQARLLLPPSVWFGSATGRRRHAAFIMLSAGALVLRGIGGVQTGQAAAVLLAGYGALLLALFFILRDMPTVAPYVGTFGLGISSLP